MPGTAVPAGDAPHFAGELRRLLRAAERRSGRKIDRALLAQAVHVSAQSIYAYLSGSRLPPAGILDALLIELGASSDQLQRLAGMRDQVEENRRAGGSPSGTASEPAATAMPQVRFSLPSDTAAFTGRDDELDRIAAALAGPSVVVAVRAIDGMPGVGKTALAVRAAHLLADWFPDRQLFIDLHAHTPGQGPTRPEDALAGLLAAVGVDPRFLPGDLEGRAGMWRDRMAGQRALLVLDNAASSAQVAPLLPGGGCLVLVTSRRHLGDLPGAVTPVLVGLLPPAEAEEMFIRLAPEAAGDRDGVAEVVGLAGFLPLAISLLARVLARHPSWTIGDLADETRAKLLTLTAENSTVAAAFDVSYQRLDQLSQRFFRLLGMHPGATADAYAAAALVGISPGEAARYLETLHGEGLLTEAGYRRYGMHDLIRRYARDLVALTPDDGSQQALGRLLDYYQHTCALTGTRLANRTRPGPPAPAPAGFEVPALDDAAQVLGWDRTERANVLACLDMVTRACQHGRVIALTAGLAQALVREGPWTEAGARHAAAVNAARYLGDRLAEANALADLAEVREMTGEYPAATEILEEALGIYRDLGNRLGEANVLHQLGILRDAKGDYPAAARFYETILAIYRDIGDWKGEANALTGLGNTRSAMCDYPGATRFYEQVLDISRVVGAQVGVATALHNLATVRQVTDDYPGAAQFLEKALSTYHDHGSWLGEAHALHELAIVRRLSGDHQGAAQALMQSLRIARDLGSRLGEANALCELGAVRRRTGDDRGAAQLLQDALGIYRDLGDRRGEANALCELGAVRRRTGDHRGAAQLLQDALGIYRDLGDRRGQAEVLNEQGQLHRAGGDLLDAQKCHQHALDHARAVGSSREEARALAGMGRCTLTGGNLTRAQDLLRQADQVRQRIGTA
jgi:tetratricopeptide (TPR) repeat protein/transcriptional regulator with XRE-family HTH domain